MKTILSLVVLCWSWAAWAQPVLRNSITTNTLGTNLVWAQPTLNIRGANPGIAFWNTSGAADKKRFAITPASDQLRFEWTSDNGGMSLLLGTFSSDGNFAPVSLSLSGETNRLSIANDQLLLDGVAVASTGNTTNIFDTTIITNNFFISGKGNTLIITNNIQFPYTTLTFSGTNVSQMNFTNSAFKLTLTTNAFIGTPTGFPGTSLMQTHLLHVQQDGTGSKTLTLTNGSFIMNGSGTSTNAVLTINTNANAYTVISFSSTPFEASKMVGVVSTLGQ